MKVLLFLSLLCLFSSVFGKHHKGDGEWTVNPFQQSVIMGLAMADANTGFITGGQNGEGANALKSTDGGYTWNEVTIGGNTFMAMAAAASAPTSAVISGLSMLSGAAQYTADGEHFSKANETGVLLETSQWADIIHGTNGMGYAIVGGFGRSGKPQANGVAVSWDAGESFEVIDCGNQEQARYGAFPSPDFWLITLGDWPNTTSNAVFPEQTIEVSRFISVHSTHKKSRVEFTRRQEGEEVPADAWYAGIMRSTDQGATWTQVFENTTFYFNQVSCGSAFSCWAVGENDNQNFVYHSADGGATWQEQLSVEGASGMAAFALSDEEVWIGGGVFGQFGVTGNAWHSVDGGNTWSATTIANNYFSSISFPTPNAGVATTLNSLQQSGLANYKAA